MSPPENTISSRKTMRMLLACMRGPRLFRRFKTHSEPARVYEPNMTEAVSQKFITVIRFCMSFTFWTSPVVLTMLYRRGYFSTEGAVSLAKFATSIGIIYSVAYLSRGIGRWSNVDYLAFIGILSAAQKSLTQQNRRLLSQFDFAYWASPIDFKWSSVNSGDVKKGKVFIPRQTDSMEFSWKQIPLNIFSYLATHTFGRRMVYPGATALINALVEIPLNQSRAKLVEEKHGVRAKVQTEDLNEIDTMFIDRRSSSNPNGKILVVCCEGNSGFYEIGCTDTPIQAGYSVIGWNHPGFGGSSGVPLPEQEQMAIDAVMQYAIHHLGFMPDNIAMFAWSIGGYTATWAAMNYPDIRFIILDATFDDILPLAVMRMPKSFKTLVEYTIRKHLDLNNAAQLLKYNGPVLLIRRTMDEMITTEVDPVVGVLLHSNRGNHLLCKLLIHRYPNIVDDSTISLLEKWLARVKSQQELLWEEHDVDEDLCLSKIRSYCSQHSEEFPCLIGQTFTQEEKNRMALYLASRYMEDFNSTHCNPLTPNFFKTPWTPNSDKQPRFK